MTRDEIIARAKKIGATLNVNAYIDLVDELTREKSLTTYEKLRMRRNAAQIAYERAEDTGEKMRLLVWWKSLCAATEDAYRQEILGQ